MNLIILNAFAFTTTAHFTLRTLQWYKSITNTKPFFNGTVSSCKADTDYWFISLRFDSQNLEYIHNSTRWIYGSKYTDSCLLYFNSKTSISTPMFCLPCWHFAINWTRVFLQFNTVRLREHVSTCGLTTFQLVAEQQSKQVATVIWYLKCIEQRHRGFRAFSPYVVQITGCGYRQHCWPF
jgi:hypothetical protein